MQNVNHEVRNANENFNLAKSYMFGTGVPKDKQKAVHYYQLAAAQGHAAAQFNLGLCYRNGTGVPKDEQEAVRLFRLAAAQGLAAAQFNLGWCYRNGTGVPKDEQEDVRLYGLAAAQGLAKEVHCALGNALLALNCPTEALASFDAALEINSRYSEARDGRDRALKTKKKWDNWRASRTQDTKTSNPEIELTAWPKKEETRDQKDQRGATDMANLGNCGLGNVNFFAPSGHLVVGTVPGDSVAENKAQPSAGC
jgi:TPR repeat protein